VKKGQSGLSIVYDMELRPQVPIAQETVLQQERIAGIIFGQQNVNIWGCRMHRCTSG